MGKEAGGFNSRGFSSSDAFAISPSIPVSSHGPHAHEADWKPELHDIVCVLGLGNQRRPCSCFTGATSTETLGVIHDITLMSKTYKYAAAAS